MAIKGVVGIPAAGTLTGPMIALVGGRVVTPGGVLTDVCVSVHEGRIVEYLPVAGPTRLASWMWKAHGCCQVSSTCTSTAAGAMMRVLRGMRWLHRWSSTAHMERPAHSSLSRRGSAGPALRTAELDSRQRGTASPGRAPGGPVSGSRPLWRAKPGVANDARASNAATTPSGGSGPAAEYQIAPELPGALDLIAAVVDAWSGRCAWPLRCNL